MTFSEFKQSLMQASPPGNLNILLKAMWYDGKEDWESAHNLAQEVNTNDGSWVHAYLHRKEGDTGNAQYWYHRAKRNMPSYSSQQEWEAISKELLEIST
jgi:hypothetical protein